jgi:hypothetical protein
MLKIAGKDAVKGLPKMEKTGKGICGPCQLGKQTRAAHKKTSGILTSKNLELLHMDLMGPTRTASLGGKRYIWLLLMTSLDIHGLFLFGKNLMPLIQLNICSRRFRLSKIPSSKNFVAHMESSRNFLLLSLLSRMELLKGRTG